MCVCIFISVENSLLQKNSQAINGKSTEKTLVWLFRIPWSAWWHCWAWWRTRLGSWSQVWRWYLPRWARFSPQSAAPSSPGARSPVGPWKKWESLAALKMKFQKLFEYLWAPFSLEFCMQWLSSCSFSRVSISQCCQNGKKWMMQSRIEVRWCSDFKTELWQL